MAHYVFKSSITGKAIERASIAELEQLLAREYPDVSLEQSVLEAESRVDRFQIYEMLLLPLENVKEDPKYHPEGDALYHSLQVFELARNELPYDEEFLLAALLHDVGKAIDRHDHVAAGLEALAGHITPRAAWLIEHHMEGQDLLGRQPGRPCPAAAGGVGRLRGAEAAGPLRPQRPAAGRRRPPIWPRRSSISGSWRGRAGSRRWAYLVVPQRPNRRVPGVACPPTFPAPWASQQRHPGQVLDYQAGRDQSPTPAPSPNCVNPHAAGRSSAPATNRRQANRQQEQRRRLGGRVSRNHVPIGERALVEVVEGVIAGAARVHANVQERVVDQVHAEDAGQAGRQIAHVRARQEDHRVIDDAAEFRPSKEW